MQFKACFTTNDLSFSVVYNIISAKVVKLLLMVDLLFPLKVDSVLDQIQYLANVLELVKFAVGEKNL